MTYIVKKEGRPIVTVERKETAAFVATVIGGGYRTVGDICRKHALRSRIIRGTAK